MEIDNEKQAVEALEDWQRQSQEQRSDLAVKIGTYFAYYAGVQWITTQGFNRRASAPASRLVPDINPSSEQMLVSDNVFTKHLIRAVIATRPNDIECAVNPPARDVNVGATLRAQVLEDTLNAAIAGSGYVAARRSANFCRYVTGSQVVGLRMMVSPSTIVIGGVPRTMLSKRLCAFDDLPTSLTLDPAVKSQNLRDHERIVHSKAMTLGEIKAAYGVEIPEEKALTMEQITPLEQTIGVLSGDSVFQRYRAQSKTKAAIVHQIHLRTEYGQFRQMFIVIDVAKEKLCINIDNPVSPYGGDGLPLGMLHAHPMPDGPFGMPEAMLLKEGQDKRNVLLNLLYRQIRAHGGANWIVEKRWFGPSVTADEIRKMFTNRVLNVIAGSGSVDKSIQSPRLQEFPAPQPFINEMLRESDENMGEAVARNRTSQGELKTHISTASREAAVEQSNQVLDSRVSDDVSEDGRILKVMLGTTVKFAAEGSPATLAMLKRDGFDAEDYAVLSSIDPYDPPGDIAVRRGSIRNRSVESKKTDLMSLASLPNPPIGGQELRRSLVELDLELNSDDRVFLVAIQKAVARTVGGRPWEPMRLGPRQDWAMSELHKAQFDQMVLADPAARQRIAEAILIQEQSGLEEQMTTNPELAAQAATGGGQEQGQPQQGPATVGDLLGMLQSQGAGATGVPA